MSDLEREIPKPSDHEFFIYGPPRTNFPFLATPTSESGNGYQHRNAFLYKTALKLCFRRKPRIHVAANMVSQSLFDVRLSFSRKKCFSLEKFFVGASSMKLSGMAPGSLELKLVNLTNYDSRLWSLARK